MLRKITYSLFFCLFAMVTMSIAVAPAATAPATPSFATALSEAGLPLDAAGSMEDFLNLTPKQYRQITGNKLSLKETIVLKLAQKKIKKQMKQGKPIAGDIPVAKGLFIVFAIFIPIISVILMGIADDWGGNNWWIAALGYFLCYIPGLIYTLVKMNEYDYKS